MQTRNVFPIVLALVVAGVAAGVGMAAFVSTSDCFADLSCDNLGLVVSALTIGAVVFTLVLIGSLVWTLSRRAANELRTAASAATVTAGVLGAAWGLVWFVELEHLLAVIFPIVSLGPLLAWSASWRRFLLAVAGTLVCLWLCALVLFVWYLPTVIVQTALLALAVWARRRSHRLNLAATSATVGQL